MLFQTLDEPMTRRRLKLSWINFAGKFEKGARVFPEVVNVKHSLRVRQIGKVFGESGVDSISRSKIGNSARDRNSRSGENENILGVSDEVDDVLQGVDVWKFLSPRRFADHIQDNFPQRQLVQVIGNFSIAGNQILKNCFQRFRLV